MVEFKEGARFKKNPEFYGNGNMYKVIQVEGRAALVECIDFYGPEDLGDGIQIFGFGQTAWIAKYFEYLFI